MSRESDYEQFKWLLNETEPCRVPYDSEGKPNDPDKWTGNWTNSTSPEVAQDLCAGCHVLEQCRAYAILHEKDFIWGGMTPEERREELNARRLRAKEARLRLTDNTKSKNSTEEDRPERNR